MKAGRMVFPTHYFNFVSEKVEIALILPQKVIQTFLRFFVKFDHELARTSDLDV